MVGGPLLDDFLGKSRSLLHSPEIVRCIEPTLLDKLKKSFQDVFDYQDKLYRTRQFLGIDVNNLETLFSILDMEWQTARMGLQPVPFLQSSYSYEQLTNIRESLFSLIVATLKMLVSDVNEDFNKLILKLVASDHSAIITFNYDLSIERAFGSHFSCYYGYSEKDPEDLETNVRRLFKLHGSVNWTYCPDCHNMKTHLNYVSPLQLAGINLPTHHSEECKQKNKILNVILPPTWYKYNYLDSITRIWRRSIRELSTATHVVVIGYSFPRTDVFFDQLLTLGLRENQNLKRIIIINPSKSIQPILEIFFDTHFRRRSVSFFQTGIEKLNNATQRPVDYEEQIEDIIALLSPFRVL